jgi:hypothetical protein
MRVKDLVRELAALPLRHNTLQRQRKELGLSRAALARILEVDPATIYRQELRNPMSVLWYYALQGIRAEAKSKESRRARAEHGEDLARHDFLTGPTRVEAEGRRYTGEKMRQTSRKHSEIKKEPPSTPRSLKLRPEPRPVRGQRLSPEAVKAAADRAEQPSKPRSSQ